MKKYFVIYSCFTLLCLYSAYAQIGINTESPLTLFHIDPANNTTGTTTNPSNDSDDVVISSTGNMGIGTINPNYKMDIVTGGTPLPPQAGFKLNDGTEDKDIYLISDANGVGSWGVPATNYTNVPYSAQVGSSLTDHTFNIVSSQNKYYSGLSITFPREGVYSVTLGIRLNIATNSSNDIIDRPVLQLLPAPADTQPVNSWASLTNRFEGSYEIMGVARHLDFDYNNMPLIEYRFSFTQNIKVDQTSGLTAYVILYIASNTSVSTTARVYFGGGEPSLPQTAGGSYVRIN